MQRTEAAIDPDFDATLKRLEARLPRFGAAGLRFLRTSSPWLRAPLAVALVAGGFLGFLPILGFWMLPLGLVLIAHDVAWLRGPMARALAWAEHKWPAAPTSPRA